MNRTICSHFKVRSKCGDTSDISSFLILLVKDKSFLVKKNSKYIFLSLEDIFPKSLFLKFDPLLEGGLLALNNEISFLKGRDRDLSEMILELQEENEFLKDIIEKNTSTIDDHIDDMDDEGEEMKFEVEMHSHPIVPSG